MPSLNFWQMFKNTYSESRQFYQQIVFEDLHILSCESIKLDQYFSIWTNSTENVSRHIIRSDTVKLQENIIESIPQSTGKFKNFKSTPIA